MAFTLDDRPTLDVGTSASPRWQRFAGGRRLAYVGYRRRLLRIALGTVGAALVGGTLAVGDAHTAAETWSSAIATANEITRDATSTTETASRSITSSWDTLAAWARIDTPPRRQPPEAHAGGGATAASPTTVPSPAAAGDTVVKGLPTSGEESGKVHVAPTVTDRREIEGRSGTNPTATAVPIAAAPGSPAPSPTTGTRQPVGTPIVVVTSTPAAVIATATVPRPTTVPATATAPRPAPTAAKPAGPVVHQVVVGDTLWGIASRYGSSVEAIVRANRLPDADSIVLGAKLVIPR